MKTAFDIKHPNGKMEFSRKCVCIPRPDCALRRFAQTMTLISKAIKKGAFDIKVSSIFYLLSSIFYLLSSIFYLLSMTLISFYQSDIILSKAQLPEVF